MKRAITRLNRQDTAIILMLLEGATLFTMGAINQWFPDAASNPAILGILVGIFGTTIALTIWHSLGLKIRFEAGKKKHTITRIAMLQAGMANAAFLATLFTIQTFLPRTNTLSGIALFGFASVTPALLALILIYNVLPFKIKIAMPNPVCINKASLWTAPIAGMYEAIILPIMTTIMNIPASPVFAFTLAGLASGFVGGWIGTMIFNLVAPKTKLWVETG